MSEAAQHPHITARGTLVEFEGLTQPAPAPVLAYAARAVAGGADPGEHTDEVLTEWGFASADVARLREAGAIR